MGLLIFAGMCGVWCSVWLIKFRYWDTLAAVVAGIGVFLFPPAFLVAFIKAKSNDRKTAAKRLRNNGV